MSEGREWYKLEYLSSPHWHNLTDKLIYSNPKAKCFICQKTNTLLLHHIKYENLHNEELLKIRLFHHDGDVMIVCFDCHTNIHFIRLLGILKIRVPLVSYILIKRALFLALIKAIQKRKVIRALTIFLFYLF